MRGERRPVADRGGILIEPVTRETLAEWIALRSALWPETPEQEHRSEAESLIGESQRFIACLARTPQGLAVGFAEAALRQDYVNGCTTSPVAFLEGIYVTPEHRRRGVARLLCEAVQAWGAGLGCSELASDADIGNIASQRMHAALGFEETERVVYFRKLIAPGR